MHCPKCRSTAVKERPERTAQGYRRFRCLDCAKQFNERSGGLLNRTQYPSDVIALVVLWRLRSYVRCQGLGLQFFIPPGWAWLQKGDVAVQGRRRDRWTSVRPALMRGLVTALPIFVRG